MQTQGHLILNLGILGHKKHPEWTWPILLGALYPDAGLFLFYAWTRLIQGIPDSEIWGQLYFQETWQTFFSVFNSIPLAIAIAGCALYYRRDRLAMFFWSATLHCLQDLPLHHDDGHRHFWPLSNYRFQSPVSYWDRDHHAVWGAGLEIVLVAIASYWIWQRSQSPWGRFLLIFFNIFYLTTYLLFFRI